MLYIIVDPSGCDVRILCCISVNSMPLLPAAIRSAFKGKAGLSLHKSSSSICSGGVMGRSGVFGTVSPPGMSSWSLSVEPFEETSTTSCSGYGVNGQGHDLTCNGLVLAGPATGAHWACSSLCCWKYSDHEE